MTIQVTGTLRTPMGLAIPDTFIRVTATAGSPEIMPESVAFHATNFAGVYDFELDDGEYLIDILYTDTYEIAGSSIVNEGTPSPVTLHELFKYTTPIDPVLVTNMRNEWETLIGDLIEAFDTEKQEIREQLVDGDAAVITAMQLYTNDRLGSELAILTAAVITGDAQSVATMRSYTDDAGNVFADAITGVSADMANAQFAITANKDYQDLQNAAINANVQTALSDAAIAATAYSDTQLGLAIAAVQLQAATDNAAITAGYTAYSDAETDRIEALVDAAVGEGGTTQSFATDSILAALGYRDGDGIWVDGPLSSSYRDHTITTPGGNQASIGQAMSAFETVDGTVVAKGSMLSDVNGRVAGYRTSNDGKDADFEIIADRFAVGHMTSSTQYVRDVYWDNQAKEMVIKGRLFLTDGTEAGAPSPGLFSIVGHAGVFPASSVANTEFLANFGRLAKIADQLTYMSDSAGSISESRYFDGSVWTDPRLVVAGSMIVRDTISANHMQANSIAAGHVQADAIDGTNIKASSTITAGTGTETAGMNGNDSLYAGWRFWAGLATPSGAPFRVTSTGKVYADDAVISGSITANSGNVAGRLQVGAENYLDGSGQATAASFGSGKCTIGKNGDFYAQNGRFEGTILASKISGDVVAARRYWATAQSSYRSGGGELRLRVSQLRVNGAQPYARNLVVRLHMEVEARYVETNSENGTGNNGNAHGKIIAHGNYGTHSSTTWTVTGTDKSNGNQVGIAEVIIPIPAYTTGWIYIDSSLVESSGGQGYLTVRGTTGNYYIATLFQNGTDLS